MDLLTPLTKERRQQTRTSQIAELQQRIVSALAELRGYSELQQVWIQEIAPVDDLVQEIGSAIETLRSSGDPIPDIDLTGIDPQFMVCFECHPATKEVAEWHYRIHQQASLKHALLAKWEPRGYRPRRGVVLIPALDSWPGAG